VDSWHDYIIIGGQFIKILSRWWSKWWSYRLFNNIKHLISIL